MEYILDEERRCIRYPDLAVHQVQPAASAGGGKRECVLQAPC